MMTKTDAKYSMIVGFTWVIFVVIHSWLVEATSRQEHEEVMTYGAATAGGGWNPPVEFFPAKKKESGESGEQIMRGADWERPFSLWTREEGGVSKPLPSGSMRSCPGRHLILITQYCTV